MRCKHVVLESATYLLCFEFDLTKQSRRPSYARTDRPTALESSCHSRKNIYFIVTNPPSPGATLLGGPAVLYCSGPEARILPARTSTALLFYSLGFFNILFNSMLSYFGPLLDRLCRPHWGNIHLKTIRTAQVSKSLMEPALLVKLRPDQ